MVILSLPKEKREGAARSDHILIIARIEVPYQVEQCTSSQVESKMSKSSRALCSGNSGNSSVTKGLKQAKKGSWNNKALKWFFYATRVGTQPNFAAPTTTLK
ncbi:hypothetical protein MLD38_023311 [Melastoma candidum]|uniref:Uncharacterized protein n=1 Tax=Melastoma candidum TaxID=119954 RepID=A0ACB9QM10_9MYRT|nr:hypothetical protein MLD38_023311 [Melastoma candidum]